MNTTLYPIQKKLFDFILSQYRDRASAIAHYQKKYNCSRSKAYAHFNGQRAVEGDHILHLLSEYGLHGIDIWPEGWPETHFVGHVLSLQPNLDAYLAILRQDLGHLNKSENGQLFHATNDVPLLLLKTRRRLAGFLLYYQLNFERGHPQFKNTKFGAAFMNNALISNWLDGYRETLHIYHEIPGVEYWSPRMLDALMVKIKLVHSLQDFSDLGEYGHLADEINILVREMESMVERSAKLMGAALKVYNHQGLLQNDVMIGQSKDLNFIYIEHGFLDIHRLQQTDIIQTRLTHLNGISSLFPSLTEQLPARRTFFLRLDQQIAEAFSSPSFQ